MKRRISQILFFLFAFAILGYVREFFFVHLNIIMYAKYYQNTPVQPLPAIMNPFNAFSYDFLYYSKYLFTILFVALFYGLNYLAIKKLTQNNTLVKLLLYSYLVMFVIAAISMLFGYTINGRLQDDEYTLSRWLMGIAQSPIICLILLASEKLYQKTTTP